VLFGIRPENLSIGDSGVSATVDVVEHLGSETIVYAAVKGLDSNVIVKIPTDHTVAAGNKVCLCFDMNKSHLFDYETKQSIMGVPAVNKFDCRLSGGKAYFAGEERALPTSFSERFFDFAESACTHLYVTTAKVTTEPVAEGVKINGVVDFTFAGSDSLSVFSKVDGKDDYFVVRTKNFDIKAGDKVTFYIPYDAMSFCDDSGVRLNCREVVSDNAAPCEVKTAAGVTTINVGGSILKYNDLGVGDGKYIIKLISDKLGFVFDKKYAKKNGQIVEKKPNVLVAKAYDEDKLGGKNAVFLSVRGWDGYVTAVLGDAFSVYKMPVFGLEVPEGAFTLTPTENA
ncbi:MAG: TOBE domain-containing protein, partial [Clostridia bacterium]|nr:TOBE domain-containing protein [Clostridia bacterium]